MTFHDYVKAIKNTKSFRGSLEEISIELFAKAGAEIELTLDTAKSWIVSNNSKKYRNTRRCRIKDYFPNKKINESGFIEFFTEHLGSSWEKLQKAFNSMNSDCCIVDLNIDNPIVFYRSLINQFQVIFIIPLTKEPEIEMLKIFKQTLQDYLLKDLTFTIKIEEELIVPFEEELSVKIRRFINKIDTDIIESFKKDYSELVIYKHIKEFSSSLGYLIMLPVVINALFQPNQIYKDFDNLLNHINFLYNEICGNNTDKPTNVTIWPSDMDKDLKFALENYKL